MKTFVQKNVILFVLAAIISPCMAIDGVIVQTTDYAFREKWNYSPSTSTSLISISDTVFHEQTLFITAIASDCKLDSRKMADVVYSVKVFYPDHTLYTKWENIPLFQGKSYDIKHLHMSQQVQNLTFQGKEPLGTYRIEMVITDNVAKTSKTIESKLVLANLPSYESISFNMTMLEQWMDNYYLHPCPEQALAAYLYASQQDLLSEETRFWPILSMEKEIYQHNSFLYPQLLDCFSHQDTTTQQHLLVLIHYLGLDDAKFRAFLSTYNQWYLSYLDSNPYPDIYGEINSPVLLDMLWGNFMASGSYQPILKLIHTLDYAKYEKCLEKYKNNEDLRNASEKELNDVVKYMSYKSLVWSLTSNCRRHNIVKQYCEWASEHEKLSKQQRKDLKSILENSSQN